MISVRDQIASRLSALNPSMMNVSDDSAAHAGHAGARDHAERTGAVDGTHFELTIVSNAFLGKSLIARHRMIYELLGELMRTHIHALKIDARASVNP
jgi:BolA family transcriptional regulator, general stress-responsive regulator